MVVLSEAMHNALDEHFWCEQDTVPEVDTKLLFVLDYSPSEDEPVLSIVFDLSNSPKCWMTASHTRLLNNKGPSRHDDYKRFTYKDRQFYPYSIRRLPTTSFGDIGEFATLCQRLYRHAVLD